MKPLWLIVLLTTLAGSQQAGKNPTPSMQAESSGKCSPNILSNQAQVQFVCKATMDTATAGKIVALLNRILQQQSANSDETEVNRKLDENFRISTQ